MTIPGVIALTKESVGFVFGNIGTLVRHLRIIFPVLLFLMILEIVGTSNGMAFMPAVTLIPNFILMCLFVLSWHRVSLMGTGSDHSIDPFNLRQYDWGFIGIVLLLGLIPAVPLFLVGFAVGYANGTGANINPGFAGLLLIPIMIALFVVLTKLYFVLPARSVGVKLTFREAWMISRGATWPVIGSMMLMGVGLMIAAFIFLFVFGIIAGLFGGGEMSTVSAFILMVPILVIQFLFGAIYITLLSRAYRWGAENNTTV